MGNAQVHVAVAPMISTEHSTARRTSPSLNGGEWIQLLMSTMQVGSSSSTSGGGKALDALFDRLEIRESQNLLENRRPRLRGAASHFDWRRRGPRRASVPSTALVASCVVRCGGRRALQLAARPKTSRS